MAALLKAALSLRIAPNMLPSFSWNTLDFNCSAPFMLDFSFAFVPLLHLSQFSASSRGSYGSQPNASCCLCAESSGGAFCLEFLQRFQCGGCENGPMLPCWSYHAFGWALQAIKLKECHFSYSTSCREQQPALRITGKWGFSPLIYYRCLGLSVLLAGSISATAVYWR